MKNIKIILTIILAFSLLQLVNAQQFPDDIQYQSIAPPATPAFPNYLESVVDNSVSNSIEITRVTELVNYVDGNGDPQIWYPTHEYAKTQVWNTDQTKYKIASWKVYNTTTYQEIHQLVNMDPSYWSNTDPDLMWSFRENGDVKKHIISTNNTQIVANIPGYEVIKLGPGEGNMDKNDHYVALVGKKINNDLDVIIFNLQTLQIDHTQTFQGAWGNGNTSSPDFIDWVSVSQSGDYVVINWRNALNQINNYYLDQAGVNHYGVEVYNRADMVFQNRIIPYGNHGDFGYAIDGDEVYVQFYGQFGGGKIYMHKLNGTASSIVLNTHSDFGVSGHISCRNINRPGWAYVTMSELDESAQIVAVKLDNSGLTEHFGHHFSSALSYDQAAMAVASPNGDKICFKSDFGTDPVSQSKVAYSFFANIATPLSIQDEHLNNVSIYPNPATNFIKIKSIKTIKNITIYNVTGQKIKTFLVKNPNMNTINTTNLSSGFYYLKITTEKEKIIKKVIIANK